jgi:hypothetical protein
LLRFNVAQVRVTVVIPDGAGASSAWVLCPLVRVTSVTLSGGTTADQVTVFGSNDGALTPGTEPTAAVLGNYTGGTPQQNQGLSAFNFGGFGFIGVVRNTANTTGLFLYVVGDDGTAGSTATVNQGNPNAGGAVSWPVVPEVYTSVTSAGSLVASIVLKTAAGTHYSSKCTLDASAGAGTYYVQFLRCASGGAVPPDGPVTHLHAPQTIKTSGGTAITAVFDDTIGGIAFSAPGACIVLSTTQFTKTIAPALLTVDSAIL